LNGVIVTKLTIKSYKQPLGFVIAVGVDTSNLQELEERDDVKAIVVIDEDISNVEIM